jgi:ATP-dependent helicase/nuclease subunit B
VDPFVLQLAELCRKDKTRAKWVIVPAHSIGHALGERLALEGTPWANLLFCTPYELALGTAAPLLVEQGLDPVPEELGPALVMRLLMELPDGTPVYFRELADQPRMGEALWNAVGELRLAGIRADDLRAAAVGDPCKHAELQALLHAYEDHLDISHQADAADLYRAATARIDWTPVRAGDIRTELPGIVWPPLVRAFIDALPGERLQLVAPHLPGLAIPRRLAAARGGASATAATGGASSAPTDTNAREEMGCVGPLAFLIQPAEATSTPAALARAAQTGAGAPPGKAEASPYQSTGLPHQAIDLFHAAGREAEVQAVFRRILNGPPTPLDLVEISCAAPDYATLVWEKAKRFDLPVTIEQGIPVLATRPAHALVGLCDWIDADYPAGRLRRLFQSGALTIDLPDGGGAWHAARLLVDAEATWGRDTYERTLAPFAARCREEPESEDDELDEESRARLRQKAARAEALRDWMRDLLALIPAPDADRNVPLAALVAALKTIVETRATIASALDAAAVAAIAESLQELTALGDLRRPVRQAVAFVRDAVNALVVGASRARPGHLHVSSLSRVGYSGRPRTFIVGLQEGGVFPALIEDAVLLDAERREIHEALATSHDRLEEAVYSVVSRLAVLLPHAAAEPERPETRPAICFSYSCRDLREFREIFPSWLVLQAFRLQQHNPNFTYQDLAAHLGEAETLVPADADQALAEADWWLAQLKEAGERGLDDVLKAFPALARGREADEARASDEFTAWDGLAPSAAKVLDPRLSGEPASATRLEALAGCPFRYLVEHGLGVEVPDDEPDQDAWLDALARGAALHDVFAKLGREARAKGRRLTPAAVTRRAREIADAKLAELREAMPPPSDVVFERERQDFLRDVDLFLQFEARRGTSEPIAFEVTFGIDTSAGEVDEREPLAQREPIEVELGDGKSLALRGKIDRIDRLPDGTYEVIDYKTGGFYPDKYDGAFGGGGLLQHAVYGIAAATLLKKIDASPTIARFVYEFPSAKGGGERVAIDPQPRAKIGEVLSDLLDVIASGTFVSAQDAGECRFCDFSRACGMPVDQAAAKVENAGNKRLEAYRRLTSHE